MLPCDTTGNRRASYHATESAARQAAYLRVLQLYDYAFSTGHAVALDRVAFDNAGAAATGLIEQLRRVAENTVDWG
jgi:hypothetical protein